MLMVSLVVELAPGRCAVRRFHIGPKDRVVLPRVGEYIAVADGWCDMAVQRVHVAHDLQSVTVVLDGRFDEATEGLPPGWEIV